MFAVQLILNVLWSCIFFGLENPGLAFVEVLCLWTAHHRDDGDVLVPIPGGRDSFRTLLGLGQLRQRAELYDLAVECVGLLPAINPQIAPRGSGIAHSRAGRTSSASVPGPAYPQCLLSIPQAG